VESKIFIAHDIKCAVNASTAGKGDCDCGAVEQAEKQKPIAWLYIEPSNIYGHVHIDNCDYSQFPYDEWIAVYTAPHKREWVGLTDAELAEFSAMKLGAYDLCLEVEAKLRERNT
jgi:hypothetical protein